MISALDVYDAIEARCLPTLIPKMDVYNVVAWESEAAAVTLHDRWYPCSIHATIVSALVCVQCPPIYH